jgi:hypothetical protein
MKMLFCNVCDRKITIDEVEEFNHTDDGGGPYCDVCWFFVKELMTLEARVVALETANKIPLL